METEQHIYFFESIDTVSQACHLFSNHTLVYLYSGRLYLRNQCGETLDIERGDSAFIGRDSYSHIYAEPELHEPCRVLFFSLPARVLVRVLSYALSIRPQIIDYGTLGPAPFATHVRNGEPFPVMDTLHAGGAGNF